MMGNGMLRNALGFGAAGGALAGGLGQLGSQGMLGDLSSIISAPGDYTRGILAGSPGERMGGRDLLRQYGLAGEDDNWTNFLAGMGTDMLTDPLTYAGAMAGGAGKIAGNMMVPGIQQDARLARFAEQAANASRAVATPEEALASGVRINQLPLEGLPRQFPAPQAGLPAMGSPQLPMEDFLNPEVMSQLEDMRLRINPRNAAWDALAQAREQMAAQAPALPMMPQGTPPALQAATPSLLAGEGVGWNPMMVPPELPSMQLPKTNPMMASPPSVMAATNPDLAGRTPLSLPGPLDAGLGESYGAQAMGMTPPLPMGAQGYQRVNPRVQALLEALGIPPEMQASFPRGQLPPWAQLRGGNVMMAQGVLPQDVLGGARRAAGY